MSQQKNGTTTSPLRATGGSSASGSATATPPAGASAVGIPAWPERPTAAQRTGAQHAVARLFDALAPQKPPARRDGPAPAIQRHRSPSGCVLQAATRAVTVSWFPASVNDTALGELQLIAWRGTVARPGAPRPAGAAVVELQETFVLLPGTVGAITASMRDDWFWRREDGTTYDARAFADRCHALLEAAAAAA